MKPVRVVGRVRTQPWIKKVEAKLRERKGVMLLELMTDEIGAQQLLDGQMPAYVLDQCRAALEWCCTDARGIVKAIRRKE